MVDFKHIWHQDPSPLAGVRYGTITQVRSLMFFEIVCHLSSVRHLVSLSDKAPAITVFSSPRNFVEFSAENKVKPDHRKNSRFETFSLAAKAKKMLHRHAPTAKQPMTDDFSCPDNRGQRTEFASEGCV
ncbi:MAG: hypothetical protein ACP5R6_02705 [Chlorobaculum sp.]